MPDNNHCLHTFTMHGLEKESGRLLALLREERVNNPAAMSPADMDPETAARFYLRHALQSGTVPEFIAPKADGVESDFRRLGTEKIPLTGTTFVKFRQTFNTIPVYGSLVTVELDERNELLSLNSSLGEPRNVDPIAEISPAQVLKTIQKEPGSKKDLTKAIPQLYYYFDSKRGTQGWRLVYIVETVPVTRGRARKNVSHVSLFLDFVVDGHSGRIVAELQRTPYQTGEDTAKDARGQLRRFRVEVNGEDKFLENALLKVRTFDFGFKDVRHQRDQLPGSRIGNPPEPWSHSAVSAHANAEVVARFLREVLLRNSFDNRGGSLDSSINCIAVDNSSRPRRVKAKKARRRRIWRNAKWGSTGPLYGQIHTEKGLTSLAANLDVVAHEIFHGVTLTSARLEHGDNQSGALNESYSDIFAAIIHNFDVEDVQRWDWTMGKGFGTGGKPFRDMRNPARLKHPKKMKEFIKGEDPHINAGIHNFAAYRIMSAIVEDGRRVLSAHDAAAIFYIALTQHLSRTSRFSNSRRAVLLAAYTVFRNLPEYDRIQRINAIEGGFDAAGIV